MMQEKDILVEIGDYWISTARAAGLNYSGYAVWENGATSSRLVARIGFDGDMGLERAKAEANKRNSAI